jgi:hypothetical protein
MMTTILTGMRNRTILLTASCAKSTMAFLDATNVSCTTAFAIRFATSSLYMTMETASKLNPFPNIVRKLSLVRFRQPGLGRHHS